VRITARDINGFTRADAGLVVAQLSYRAKVTRSGPPRLGKLVELYGGFTRHDPTAIMQWTDECIAYAVGHRTLPDIDDPFPTTVMHNSAASFLTVAQTAFRGGFVRAEPSPRLIEREHGPFESRGSFRPNPSATAATGDATGCLRPRGHAA
jgi:hypothetical protein